MIERLNMQKITSLLIILLILLIGCADSISETPNAETTNQTSQSGDLGQILPIRATTIVGDQVIELEVAQTPEQQALGLMYRQSLSDNRGMIFPFKPPRMTKFWMKNVSIPLDMIFLLNNEIQAVEANVPPCNLDPCPSYGPNMAIDQVIELRGGRAEELNLKKGDMLIIDFF